MWVARIQEFEPSSRICVSRNWDLTVIKGPEHVECHGKCSELDIRRSRIEFWFFVTTLVFSFLSCKVGQ